MDETSDNCLVCFNETSTFRKNIQPYICDCNYPIHNECFTEWKRRGTLRLCLICQVHEQIEKDTHVVHIGLNTFIILFQFMYTLFLFFLVILWHICHRIITSCQRQ
jgi:hypothetical protein